MLRHTVLFGWSEDATEAQKKRAADEVARLPSLVPSVRAFACGPDAGVNEGNFDFAVTADFDDVEGYLAYRDNPAHRAMVEQHILPIAAKRAAIQFEY
ncbi:MAG TPA: Dabb family protein [Streptosporangiaceae bacterium]|nr:Dabb family protein [Streptosporangiaceae bacterium]